ncbi:MAG: PAS domain S-box protein [Kofleriaceae bacterium]
MKRLRDLPLWLKLAFGFVVIALLPMTVSSYLDLDEMRARVLADETDLLGARADALANDLDEFNRGYQRAASRLSHVPEVISYAGHPDLEKRASLTARLTIHIDQDPGVRGVALLSSSGVVLAGTEPREVGSNKGFRSYVATAAGGHAVISDPYLAENGVPTIAYASPVRDDAGDVVGIIAFWVRAEALWKVARRANGLAGEGSYATIVDHDGVRIADTSHLTTLFRPVGPLPSEAVERLVGERRFGANTRALLGDVEPFDAMVERLKTAGDTSVFEGNDHYGVARSFKTVPWTAFYVVPSATLEAPTDAITRRRMIVSGAIFAFALLGGLALAALMLKPWRKIVTATRRLEAGDMSARVSDDRKDELGELGRAFDAMAEQLAKHRDDLEMQVAERTVELVASELKYREIYETSPDMHISYSAPDNTITDVNETLLDRLGYTREEMIGQPYPMIYDTADWQRQLTARQQQFDRDHKFTDVERRLKTKSGQFIEVSLNLVGVFDEHGKHIAGRSAFRDITRRFQEERDRAFQLQVGEALRASADIPAVLDAVAKLLSEYLGARCVLAREYGAIVEDATFVVRAKSGSLHVVGGDRVWDSRELTLVDSISERVWLWVDHLEVLAKLKDAAVATAIQRTEAKYQALVESVRDYAIYMLDTKGKVKTWNGGAARLKGYTADEIVGQSFKTFYTDEDRTSGHPDRLLERVRAEGRVEDEGYRVRKDGSMFWANVAISAVYDPVTGKLEGFSKVTRDFTERRARQQALAQSLKEREVLLQEVHHRVKNNLQVISSLINMQVRKLDRGETRDALEECQTRVLAIALIHEKLYQSKDYSQVRFAEYARSLAASVFHATGTSASNVQLDLAIEEVPLAIDRAIPCGLVINELITNSLKHGFAHGRHGTLRVELGRIADDKLRLIVEDDGVGLPAGFDVQTAHSMGMQLVATLAEQLEAELVVSNDNGASFQLTFAS